MTKPVPVEPAVFIHETYAAETREVEQHEVVLKSDYDTLQSALRVESATVETLTKTVESFQSALRRAQEERTEATAYGNKAVREISALAALLHWPYCWDTAAYPDLDSCIKEIFKCSTCEEIMIRSMGGSE